MVIGQRIGGGPARWLQRYYALRAFVASMWIAAALALRGSTPAMSAALLALYPAWDAVANVIDARKCGGLARNRAQATNAAVSLLTALGIYALAPDLILILALFGLWAILAGLLQLGAAAPRWPRAGAQRVMVLSGAQSAIIGVLFLLRARAGETPVLQDFVPYAAFGAFYFTLAALRLAWGPSGRLR